MDTNSVPLTSIYEGWEGYNTSLVKAIAPRTREELAWRPAAGLKSVGEIADHIARGRIDWFSRMDAPGAREMASQSAGWRDTTEDAVELVSRLEISWRMVEAVLKQWTVADLWGTYLQPYQGKTYAVSRQWTIWRIMAHDIQHGGQVSVMLYAQGIDILELGDLGGHLTEPPLAPAH
jgi:uncharacterized damage-inducible protein DinB